MHAPRTFPAALDAIELPELRRRHGLTVRRWQRLASPGSVAAWDLLETRQSEKDGILPLSKRCSVFVTGSMARYEAAESSDLDVFIIDGLRGDEERPEKFAGDHPNRSSDDRLTFVETSQVVTALDASREVAKFPPLSRGGEFARPQSLRRMIDLIGSPRDDAENTFTARMLLLLDSASLFNEPAHSNAVISILDRYWRGLAAQGRVLPIMLTNDIRRWWSVLCLNFELYYPQPDKNDQDYDQKVTKRALANLKLRYARLLGCYTPLLSFIAGADAKGISRTQVEAILSMTPIERLAALFARGKPEDRDPIEAVLRSYDKYLTFAAKSDDEQLEQFKGKRRELKDAAYVFHSQFARLFTHYGSTQNPIYQYCII